MFKKRKGDLKIVARGLACVHAIEPWYLLLRCFYAAVEALFPFINIAMSALLIDAIVAHARLEDLLRLVLLTVFLNVTVLIGIRLLNRRINIKQARFFPELKMTISKKILTMEYPTVEKYTTHMQLEKIKEMENLNGGGFGKLIDSFSGMIRCVFTLFFSVGLSVGLFLKTSVSPQGGIYSLICSPLFSLILLLLILLNVVTGVYSNMTVTKKMYRIMNDILPFNRIFGYYIDQYVGSYHAGKDIRLYNQKNLIMEEYASLFGGVDKTLDKLASNQCRYANLNTIASSVIGCLVYIFVGFQALAGLFGAGSIVQYAGSINEFVNGLSGFMNQITALHTNNEALQTYFEFMDTPSRMYRGTLPVEKRDDNEYEIEFRDVSFRYPSSSAYALRHVSLKLRIGERLAVVGRNGSGKTTFIKLLCRLYDPTEGEILLNGINIQKYTYSEYLSLFSVVFQDFKLFSFSLGQNVAACVEYDKTRVAACLKKAGMEERYATLTDGTKTCLYRDFEEKGVEISGGEAQKIALARALYKNAPFIVLDEPTAALDPVAEFEIYRKFNEIVGGKTAVYISHRLSSCRFCDDIAVFDRGRLVERGSHETLAADTGSVYNQLWRAQAQYYVTG